MVIFVCRAAVLLFALSGVIAAEYNAEIKNEEIPELPSYITNDEYIRNIHSMINAYRANIMGGRLVIETNAFIDTKYRTWKRNADLINSLLALPKGMNDAGR